MGHDLDRGNRLELDWLAGQVSRLGKELKVPTPVNDTVYAALKLFRMGTRA
jgi:2-dehydropantoate 2-reductase